MKILVAVDGSIHSYDAVDHVVRLARELRTCEVILVNVQETIEFRALALYREEMLAELHENCDAALAGARERLQAAGLTHEERREIGEPAEMIAEIATVEKVDLVVLGTRGLGSIAGLLFGSVAMKVLHLVEMPVTLVK